MAGYISRKSADRWNRAAGIVEGGGAGSHFVQGLYRPPKGGSTTCDNLGGLLPGSYPAVAGATIAAGASGPVVYNGVVYQIKNQSQCQVLFGDLVGLHVSPNCEAFFIPCVCSCETPEPTDCCDKTYSICIDGTTQIVKTTSTDLAGWPLCCALEQGSNVKLFGYITCNSVLEQVVFNWVIGSGLSGRSGTIVLDGLCSTGEATETLDLSEFFGYECIVTIKASDGLVVCDDCSGNPPSAGCCDLSRWFCLNGVSQQLAFDGGTYTWDVSACCETTASFKITMSCNPVTGIPTMGWEYTAGLVFDSGNINVVELCNSTAPKIYTFPGITCFLQMLVSFVQFECTECLGGESPPITTPPPP